MLSVYFSLLSLCCHIFLLHCSRFFLSFLSLSLYSLILGFPVTICSWLAILLVKGFSVNLLKACLLSILFNTSFVARFLLLDVFLFLVFSTIFLEPLLFFKFLCISIHFSFSHLSHVSLIVFPSLSLYRFTIVLFSNCVFSGMFVSILCYFTIIFSAVVFLSVSHIPRFICCFSYTLLNKFAFERKCDVIFLAW